MKQPTNDGPYRDDVDAAMKRKSDHREKIDHREPTNSAKIFDTLVTSNVELVKTMRAGMKAGLVFLVIFTVVAMSMMTTAMILLRSGQEETRSLISALTKKNCVDPSTQKE